MKKTVILILAALFLMSSVLQAAISIVLFNEYNRNEPTCQTYNLVAKEKKDYPVGKDSIKNKKAWLVQLYKDGGDGVISPLDEKGKPTGDDVMITDPFNYNHSQKLLFPLKQAWHMNAFRFANADSIGQAFIGERIYLRIFNASSLEKASKYIVSHTLYTVGDGNQSVPYVPDYGWDQRGWVKFRNK